MKRTASILLLTLLAFNWGGYRLLSGFMERKADLALESQIDNSDYDESTLMEIRVPLNAPYLSRSSTEFERFDGELELGGVHYKYVKRKIVNGELVLLCLPNENKTRYQNSRVDFFKLVNDLNQSQNKGKSNTPSFKSFVTEYKKENNSWTLTCVPVFNMKHEAANNLFLAAGFNTIPKQPPKA